MAAEGMTPKIGGVGKTTTVHIGAERYKKLNDIGIKLADEGKVLILPSKFNKYLIDNFSEQAVEKLLKELKNKNFVPQD